MDQKCYQGEGWHGLKYMYQGIIISMDSLFGPLLQCTSHQHNVRIVHPTHLHIRTLYPGHLGDLQNEDEDRKYICSVTHVSRDFQ